MARATVVQPAPSAPDRVAGRIIGPWDRSTLSVCRSAAKEGTNIRWRQYRSVWAWVEGTQCRREGILRHFGDRSRPTPSVPCCDVCDPSLVPAAPVAAPRQRSIVQAGDLDGAILEVVRTAEPGVGRTRCVEVLRGGRSKVIEKYSYDGLPHYGAYRDLRADEVLAAVDALMRAGRLRSTGGRFPKLAIA
jgi:ATP-dependent DNA helicase RecQ